MTMMRNHHHNDYDRVRSDDDETEPPEPQEVEHGGRYSDTVNDGDDDDYDECGDARGNDGGGRDQEAPSSFSSSSTNSILLDEDVGVDRRCAGRTLIPRGSSPTLHHHNECSWLRLVFVAASVVAAVLTLSWRGRWAGWRQNATAATLPSSLSDCPSSPKHGGNSDNELIVNPRPHLHELIADFQTQVTGNVSWLLDFAILGHSKCSTTTHLVWLRSHPEIYMPSHEVGCLRGGRPAEMVSQLYALPNRPHKKRGYKNPLDIMNPRALDLLRVHWPDARLMVGVRHPVKWFESYYNFNKMKPNGLGFGGKDPGPPEHMNVPNHAYFHQHLMLLGKTNVSDPHERMLLGGHDDATPPPPPFMSNKVFLYESTQPFDVREGRSATYRDDLAAFLELSSPLSPIPLRGATDGETYYNYTTNNVHYIDVCDDKFRPLRQRLLNVGKVAAEWILRYFVVHPDVTVSSPDTFKELLRQWSIDPCNSGDSDDDARTMRRRRGRTGTVPP